MSYEDLIFIVVLIFISHGFFFCFLLTEFFESLKLNITIFLREISYLTAFQSIQFRVPLERQVRRRSPEDSGGQHHPFGSALGRNRCALYVPQYKVSILPSTFTRLLFIKARSFYKYLLQTL
jgi:hypothetical protein